MGKNQTLLLTKDDLASLHESLMDIGAQVHCGDRGLVWAPSYYRDASEKLQGLIRTVLTEAFTIDPVLVVETCFSTKSTDNPRAMGLRPAGTIWFSIERIVNTKNMMILYLYGQHRHTQPLGNGVFDGLRDCELNGEAIRFDPSQRTGSKVRFQIAADSSDRLVHEILAAMRVSYARRK